MLSDAPEKIFEQEAIHYRAYSGRAAQRSAQGYRNAIGAAAAARLLQPLYRESVQKREKNGIATMLVGVV
jgi:hypothetical protein